MFILWWIIVGLIAGFITGKLMKGSGFGTLMDIVVGIVGAIIGGFIMRALGFADQGGLLYTIFVAVIGAVLLHCWSGCLLERPRKLDCSLDLVEAAC